jgi:hypothetical protein
MIGDGICSPALADRPADSPGNSCAQCRCTSWLCADKWHDRSDANPGHSEAAAAVMKVCTTLGEAKLALRHVVFGIPLDLKRFFFLVFLLLTAFGAHVGGSLDHLPGIKQSVGRN